jgi:hypothetical protein
MTQPRSIILLLSGWAHSGKDSVAKILVESYEFQKLAFADPIKQRVAKEQDIPLDWCYDQTKKSEPLPSGSRTLREELIRVGEEGRKENTGFWAQQIGEKILKSSSRGQRRFVISDWRILDELWTLQKLCPDMLIVPIRIERPSQLISPVPDPTEYGLLGFPFRYILHNIGSLGRLFEQTVAFVEDDLSKVWTQK